MKRHLLLWLFLIFLQICQAQITFNPETDTIAITNRAGIWKILVPEKTLIASAVAISPNLSMVHDIRIQDIHGKPYLFLRGIHREKPEVGYTVMVLLTETSEGVWKAGNIYQGCWGATCSKCGFDEYWGCACERFDGPIDETEVSFCNHMITIGMGLAKIDAKD